MKEYAETDADIKKYAYKVEDGKGGKSRLCIWNHPGDDISGRIIRLVIKVNNMMITIGFRKKNSCLL